MIDQSINIDNLCRLNKDKRLVDFGIIWRKLFLRTQGTVYSMLDFLHN